MSLRLLLTFLLVSGCSLLESTDRIKITTQAFDKSKDKAMELAYKNALARIDEIQCDHDQGVGNVIYKRAGAGYVAEASYTIDRKHCKPTVRCNSQDWIDEPTRTQGGSWIWFKGKGVAYTRAEADSLAKGETLNHLVKECRIPHKETMFHERCEEFTANNFVIYVRASIEHRFCNESKNAGPNGWEKLASPELANDLAKFRMR